MRLKKSVRRTLIVILLIILGVLGYHLYKGNTTKEPVKEVKIINQIDQYGYALKENKTAKYKEQFKELEKILNEEEVNEEDYASKVTEMFIYDFYSLSDKSSKTDIGGVDFVYSGILENFLQNAQNTYYKYIESNIYNNRKQSLPVVSNITIDEISKAPYAYGDQTDENAYIVSVSWSYTDSQFAGYQKAAKLVWVHDGNKLSLVELQ